MPKHITQWLSRLSRSPRRLRRKEGGSKGELQDTGELARKLQESLAFVDLLEEEDAYIYTIVKGKSNGAQE